MDSTRRLFAGWLQRVVTFDVDVVHDVRHGVRLLWKRPGYTIFATAILAIGIGANVAIFTIVDHVLFRGLPYRDADLIVTLWQSSPSTPGSRAEVAPANFLDWRDRSQSFEVMAAAEPWSFDYTGSGEPEALLGVLVTERFFEALGVQPLHGRFFRSPDFVAGQDRVLVITHGLWQRRFGSNPDIVGQAIRLDDDLFTVVGVLPPTFQPRLLPSAGEREAWAPHVVAQSDRLTRGNNWWNVVARVRSTATLEQARLELETVSLQLAEEYPRTNKDVRVTVVPLREHLAGDSRDTLVLMWGAVFFVLLIACANIANLMLAQGAARAREFAIRNALGAGTRRLVRQLFAESLLLAVLGSAAGLVVAWWFIPTVVALGPVAAVPNLSAIALDRRVLLFAIALTATAALLCGLAPAVQCARLDTRGGARDLTPTATAPRRRQYARSALVITEVALALMLLAGAGLLLRSFVRLLAVDPGFATGNLAALQVFAWDRHQTREQRVAFFNRTIERLQALPGVTSVGAASTLPFLADDLTLRSGLVISGRPPAAAGELPSTYLTIATATYFGTVGVPLLRGRLFTPEDDTNSVGVAIINDTLARQQWPNEEPIGRPIEVRLYGQVQKAEIIGVVGSVLFNGLNGQTRPEVFLPHAQNGFGGMTYVIKSRTDPANLVKAAKDVIWSVDPLQTFYQASTVEEMVAASVSPRRLILILLGVFAGVALLLASIGIYAVISVATQQRTKEIGVRMALGAAERDVFRLIVGHGLGLTAIGLALGVAGALAVGRSIKVFLFGVTPFDPITLIGVSALLAMVAILASYFPARRAMRLDPLVALRTE